MGNKRDFLSLWDVTEAEFAALIRRAEELRFLRQVRTPHATRPGRVLALIFEKASTRTRVSFEVAIWELGGHAVVMGRNDSQLGRGEPIKDTARVMSRYCHGIMVRTFGHERVKELADYATVPVINGLTDLLHPCQVLADLQTVYAHFAERERKTSRGLGAGCRAGSAQPALRLGGRWQQHGQHLDRGRRPARSRFDVGVSGGLPAKSGRAPDGSSQGARPHPVGP